MEASKDQKGNRSGLVPQQIDARMVENLVDDNVLQEELGGKGPGLTTDVYARDQRANSAISTVLRSFPSTFEKPGNGLRC